MDFDTLLKLVGDDPVFDSSFLLAGKVEPKLVRIQLSRWLKNGKILQIRRGLYSLAPPYQKKQPHPFLIANHLHKASYVSLQSALSYYGLIPEVVNVTTSVSTGRPERISTPLGIYDFRHLKTELLFGYRLLNLGEQLAFVATPEKALLDLIYFQPGAESSLFLQELRLQDTQTLDVGVLAKLAMRYSSQKVDKAVQNLVHLISRGSEEYEEL
jgi:predicted transcriptional regulator of viral defense system